jgi:hypothetical protein
MQEERKKAWIIYKYSLNDTYYFELFIQAPMYALIP